MPNKETKTIADNLYDELMLLGRTKRLKVRTLMKYFNYEKRTEDSATHITELLNERDVIVHPSIMKIGDEWQLKLDDHVYLAINIKNDIESPIESDLPAENWNNDNWFDSLNEKEYRNEKEVESKFLVPLLNRLGYDENDRYDGMSVSASHGSKPTRLEVDYALFNTKVEVLKNQVLLIAEGKRFKDSKSVEVKEEQARNQAMSYAYWVSCHFGLITDGKKLEVISFRSPIGCKKIVFECRQDELKNKFKDLHKLIGKDSLTRYYEKLIKVQD